ncbi:arsenate reductase-like glutaredoxin family protein [Ewingella americana]
MTQSTVKIYHNPACGTSRNALAMIRATGTEPEVMLYLDTPPVARRAAATDCRDGDFSPRVAA